MRLYSLSVRNFRSITTAHKMNFYDISTLVWKNNEWKSNILKALNISMNILKRHWRNYVRHVSYSRRRRDESSYDWDIDFPMQLQSKWNGKTKFSLEFDFTDAEACEFKEIIWLHINWKIQVDITIWPENKPEVEIKKKWKWTKTTFWNKSRKIFDYVAERINITYIPAIRTADHAIEIVESMISKELSQIETTSDYKQAMKVINDLQKPILKSLSKKIENTLKEFIPDIKKVETNTIEYNRRRSLTRDCEIMIDDGNKTNLEYKGDGIKSLVAMSLLKDSYRWTWISLISIEEPESHLHPWAIHALRESIYDLWKSNQVIIATHNPLFVNTDNIKSNIIVSWWLAKTAKNISEIREVLWVKVSDNLSIARFVLVVEWIEDSIALKYLFNYYSPTIKKALISKTLIIDPLGWASKLTYKLSLYKSQLCKFHVLLDNDDSWISSHTKAIFDWNLNVKEATMVICKWKKESEFEDLLDFNIYKDKIELAYWVDIDCDDFKKWNEKWSKRIEKTFRARGIIVDDKIKNELKAIVANSIKWSEDIALMDSNRLIFDTLVKSVEKMII